MSYLALYRKYRPNSFDDLVGQSEVSSIIKNEILNNKLSHAYLFSGPRGTGKTSTAKIIARMINCANLGDDGVPCGCCESCLNFNSNSDIVEIDAASNNGVDEIRELRDKVNLVPTFGKYKIYIIDEVHMLTTQAFNALLKTLEEPPSHVVFILATTEFYKIPATVVSRCQKFQFLKFSNEDIVKKLKEIATNEVIDVSDEVLFEIARLSDGGLRDAINMLDQLSSFANEQLNLQDVYRLNGVVSYSEFKELLISIYSNEIVKIIEFIDLVDKMGKNMERFIADLIDFLKDLLIYKNTAVLFLGVSEKNNVIKEVSSLFSESDLYDFIFSLNELSSKIKNSSCGKVLLVTEFIKLSNTFCLKKSSLCEKNEKKQEFSEDNSCQLNIRSEKDIYSKSTVMGQNSFVGITDKLKKTRINNAFATASKTYKDAFLKKWYLIEEKLSNDTNYVSIAGMMNDVSVLVVGEYNIIFLAQYTSLLDRLFSQIHVIEQLLFDIFQIEYKIVFLLEDEWNYEKDRYISNIKSGKTYQYISENNSVNEIIGDSGSHDDLNTIISILGNDVVVYE